MAKLIFQSGPYLGKRVTLPPGKAITLGRNRDIELPLPDPKLSRKHCQIVSRQDDFFLRDLNSTNGTFINGQRLSAEHQLQPFDRIVLGDTELEFLDDEKPIHAIDTGRTPVAQPAVGTPDAPAVQAAQAKKDQFTIESSDLLDDIVEENAGAGGSPEAAPDPAIVDDAASDPGMVDDAAPIIVHATAPAAKPTPQDPFEAALQELTLELPEEPPPMAQPEERPKVLFCDGCDASITFLEYDLNFARSIGGKLFCKACLDKAYQPAMPSGKHAPITGNAPSTPPSGRQNPILDAEPSRRPSGRLAPIIPADAPIVAGRPSGRMAPVGSARAEEQEKRESKRISDILAALDEEAVVVDTTIKRRGHVVDDNDVSKAINELERVQQQQYSGNSPSSASTKPASIPVPRPQPPAPPPAPPPPRPAPKPAPAPADFLDDDLEEISQ